MRSYPIASLGSASNAKPMGSGGSVPNSSCEGSFESSGGFGRITVYAEVMPVNPTAPLLPACRQYFQSLVFRSAQPRFRPEMSGYISGRSLLCVINSGIGKVSARPDGNRRIKTKLRRRFQLDGPIRRPRKRTANYRGRPHFYDRCLMQ